MWEWLSNIGENVVEGAKWVGNEISDAFELGGENDDWASQALSSMSGGDMSVVDSFLSSTSDAAPQALDALYGMTDLATKSIDTDSGSSLGGLLGFAQDNKDTLLAFGGKAAQQYLNSREAKKSQERMLELIKARNDKTRQGAKYVQGGG